MPHGYPAKFCKDAALNVVNALECHSDETGIPVSELMDKLNTLLILAGDKGYDIVKAVINEAIEERKNSRREAFTPKERV